MVKNINEWTEIFPTLTILKNVCCLVSHVQKSMSKNTIDLYNYVVWLKQKLQTKIIICIDEGNPSKFEKFNLFSIPFEEKTPLHIFNKHKSILTMCFKLLYRVLTKGIHLGTLFPYIISNILILYSHNILDTVSK